MSPRRRRCGALLAELAVAVALGGVAAAIGGGILMAAERRARRDATTDRAAQSAREVAHVLTTEISASLTDSLVLRGDTALDLHAQVGVSLACVVTGDVVVLPGAQATTGPPFSVWRLAPEPGDLVVGFDTVDDGARWAARIDSAVARTDGAGCATSSGFRTAADSVNRVPVWRLRLGSAAPPGAGTGWPLRVFRAGRWLVHRSADRSWWLAYRRCTSGSCGAAQPVAGPLAPGDSGLVVRRATPVVIEFDVRPASGVRPEAQRRYRVPLRSGGNAPP